MCSRCALLRGPVFCQADYLVFSIDSLHPFHGPEVKFLARHGQLRANVDVDSYKIDLWVETT